MHIDTNTILIHSECTCIYSFCCSSSSTEAPRTANIKPMAAPPVVSAQGRPLIQSSAVPPMRSTAESRAMASIRPMAVQVTTATATPMATVMPTSLAAVQDTAEVASIVIPHSQASTASATSPASQRPTQQVQPVPTATPGQSFLLVDILLLIIGRSLQHLIFVHAYDGILTELDI